MAVQVIRTLVYTYDSFERAQADMGRWQVPANGSQGQLRHRGMTTNSSCTPPQTVSLDPMDREVLQAALAWDRVFGENWRTADDAIPDIPMSENDLVLNRLATAVRDYREGRSA